MGGAGASISWRCPKAVVAFIHRLRSPNRPLTTALGGHQAPAPNNPPSGSVLSDQPAGPARLRAYSKRMLIEQSFKEDKSGGFDLDQRLLNPQRLERLLLAVALATYGRTSWANMSSEEAPPADRPSMRAPSAN